MNKFAGWLMLILASFIVSAGDDQPVGEQLYFACAACHGFDGAGSLPLDAPRIAGLDAEYLAAQLNKFRSGERGAPSQDIFGQQMALFAKALPDEGGVAAVARYVADMEAAPPTPTMTGNSERGAQLYQSCVACHGPDARGVSALGAPALTGLDDWYLVRQLEGFRDGYRGYAPTDIPGTQMRYAATSLADEQALRDIAAFIRSKSTAAKQTISRRAFFGDLHVHTRFSPDAYVFGSIGLPDDAYRYAKGEPVKHANGDTVQIETPLDFLAVTDHAAYLGALIRMSETDSKLADLDIARKLNSGDDALVASAIDQLKGSVFAGTPIPELVADDVVQTMWNRIIAAAERHNEPGKFTSFIGYEWSATPENANLHRNVIFAGGANEAPLQPLSAFDTSNPEALWSYLEDARENGSDSIAIPHNSNLSDGRMFAAHDYGGEPISNEYARRRVFNEPIVEIAQIKGTSETHPQLSPDDAWANFELLDELMGMDARTGRAKGSYARDAYRAGLSIEQATGIDPFRFGVIGSSDSHNATSPVEEHNYSGKIGMGDGTPERRRTGGSITSRNIRYSAAGLAGVWAEVNTRQSLFAALRRKETFATSGPRIQVRFFGGGPFTNDSPEQAYANGVPMGATLHAAGSAPQFLVWAKRDPRSAPLERVQVIKGWLEAGNSHETIYDVICADNLSPDDVTHRCQDASAERNDTSCDLDSGDAHQTLQTVWSDPDFEPKQSAFYYVRAIERPSCRWSTWDSLRMNRETPGEVPTRIQERAWSSPIWYRPAAI